MARSMQPDLGELYHVHASNYRGRAVDVSLDFNAKPLPFRTYPGAARTALPGADFAVEMPLGAALSRRRSVREFSLGPMPLATLGRLLYASCGVRADRQPDGDWTYRRPAPSAGARYPLEVYAATQAVDGLTDGIHHYDPRGHALELRRPGPAHELLAELVLGQEMVLAANLLIVITGVPERTTWKYGQRGHRFVLLDAGHLGQNLYLVATALGLGPVGIGGFFDDELSALLELPEGERPLYLVCIGQPRAGGDERR